MDDRPIGVFDSGFGGLTVARALIDLVPAEDLVYVGDTGRYPYGPRPLGEVRAFARQIARYLVEEWAVKLVVVACNTATAAALEVLRGELEVPVVGVITPGLRAAVRATRNGRVGVVATIGTISSRAYERENRALGSPVELVCAPCPGFVEAVERGETSGERVRALAEARLGPVRAAGIDTLLLGCTHYPFLARPIADTVGREVVLVSSAEETAFEVRAILADGALARAPVLPRTTAARRALARTGPGPTALDPSDDGWAPGGGQHRWCSSGDLGLFAELGRRLLGPELDRVEAVPW